MKNSKVEFTRDVDIHEGIFYKPKSSNNIGEPININPKNSRNLENFSSPNILENSNILENLEILATYKGGNLYIKSLENSDIDMDKDMSNLEDPTQDIDAEISSYVAPDIAEEVHIPHGVHETSNSTKDIED